MVRNTYSSYEIISSYNLVVLVVDGRWVVMRDVTSSRGYTSRGQTRFRVISHVTMYSGTTLSGDFNSILTQLTIHLSTANYQGTDFMSLRLFEIWWEGWMKWCGKRGQCIMGITGGSIC